MGSVQAKDFGGKLNPKQILIESLNDADKMDVVIVVYMDKDDYILMSTSSGSGLKKIGMLDMAKDLVKQSLKDAS